MTSTSTCSLTQTRLVLPLIKSSTWVRAAIAGRCTTVLEYVDAAKNNSLAEAVSKLAQTADPSAVEADAALVEHAKVQRIRKIVDAGRDVRVDLLRDKFSSPAAYAIESAAIDVQGPETSPTGSLDTITSVRPSLRYFGCSQPRKSPSRYRRCR